MAHNPITISMHTKRGRALSHPYQACTPPRLKRISIRQGQQGKMFLKYHFQSLSNLQLNCIKNPNMWLKSLKNKLKRSMKKSDYLSSHLFSQMLHLPKEVRSTSTPINLPQGKIRPKTLMKMSTALSKHLRDEARGLKPLPLQGVCAK